MLTGSRPWQASVDRRGVLLLCFRVALAVQHLGWHGVWCVMRVACGVLGCAWSMGGVLSTRCYAVVPEPLALVDLFPVFKMRSPYPGPCLESTPMDDNACSASGKHLASLTNEADVLRLANCRHQSIPLH